MSAAIEVFIIIIDKICSAFEYASHVAQDHKAKIIGLKNRIKELGGNPIMSTEAPKKNL
jgi:hypothetical protein